MNWKDSLKEWRQVRNITSVPVEIYQKMMEEEEEELQEAIKNNDWNEQIDAICDKAILTQNQLAVTDPKEYDLIPHYRGLIVAFMNELDKLGVIPDLAMKEALKEISSRKQDPEQAKRWKEAGGVIQEKWQKDKNQDPSTLYKANYKLAKK